MEQLQNDGSQRRQQLSSKARNLAYLTVGWNAVEGIVAVLAGMMAGSIALVGFGFDSAIETLSGLVMVWRFHSDTNEQQRERIEAISLRLVGISFLLLAAYVGFDSVKALVSHEAPHTSTLGMIIAVLSLAVMPWLSAQKRAVAQEIESVALAADAKQTDFCFYLSVILLIGLACNALFHWWWADPIAALIMTPLIVKEGLEAVRGKSICTDCH